MMVWMNMNYNTCYGYYCMLLNDIPHVWHRIVANLEMIVIINLIKES